MTAKNFQHALDVRRNMERQEKEYAIAKRYVASLTTDDLTKEWESVLDNVRTYARLVLDDMHPRVDSLAAWEVWVAAGRPEVE